MASASPDPNETDLDLRALTLRALVTIVGLVAVVGGLAWLWRDELVSLGKAFVEQLGLAGLFLGFFLPDAFPLPLPHDVFSGLCLIGGVSFPVIVAVASTASLCGGTVGFHVGRRLSHTLWFQRIMTRHGSDAHALVRRYGGPAVAIGALTPLPYFIVCWAAGALEMSYRRFIVWSLLRIPRVAIYLWLVQLGFLEVG
jgi:membrane protein YqaA with SNARE-associated domain